MSGPVAPSTSTSSVQPTAQTAWVGWIAFAGVMLMIGGTFHALEGLVAIYKKTLYVVTERGLMVSLDYTAWGIVHLLIGAVLIAAGFGVLRGQLWARGVAVFVALLSAVVSFAFLPAYPVWSALLITVDILVIWALTVHGDELRT